MNVFYIILQNGVIPGSNIRVAIFLVDQFIYYLLQIKLAKVLLALSPTCVTYLQTCIHIFVLKYIYA